MRRPSPGRNTWQRPTHYQLLLEPLKWWVHVFIAKHLQPLWETRGAEDISLSLSAETSSQFPAQYEVGGGRQEESCSDPSGHSGWYRWPSTAGEKLYFAHIMLAQCEFPCWSRGVSWLTLFYILKPHTWNKLIESNWNRTVYWTCRQNIKKKCVCVGISRVTTWLFLFQNNDFAGQCRACVRL